ncbi:MAG TPA: transcription antitermination factor NusB [Deinococcales bacterium]|nr:transcription antitermination factor NusB [Deinococcales bacterium]
MPEGNGRDGAGVRRRARELAFRVLFESEQGGSYPEDVLERALADIGKRGVEQSRGRAGDPDDGYGDPLDTEALSFTRKLVLGYDEKRHHVDQTLERVIEGWTFSQMSKTDLAVLRLAGYEMMFEDTPHPPVIEVAVRIAKKYGGEESGRFVNGVLARLKRHVDGKE